MNSNLELRMYGLVNYQLTGIQKGIQFGHAVVEYGLKYFNTQLYQEWASNHKTFIIYNGGSTNTKKSLNDSLPFGTMNRHLLTLIENNVELATFYEPDLGDQLTSIVFIIDERVFNKKLYPDFNEFVKLNYDFDEKYINYNDWINSPLDDKYKIALEWRNIIGGEKNIFLREFLSKFVFA
jgi:hypothetical protein